MKRRTCLGLWLLAGWVAAWGGIGIDAGPAAGVALPVTGNFRHFPPGAGFGLDLRVTGFQPVVGLGLAAGYTSFHGPGNENPLLDSSKFSYQYVPVALCLFTDFSRLAPRSPVLPYLRIGAGPAYWDFRYDRKLVTTLDTSKSRQLDFVITGSIGAEHRLGRLPLAAFLELTGNYITSTHFEKYFYLDKDETYALLSAGIRYHVR